MKRAYVMLFNRLSGLVVLSLLAVALFGPQTQAQSVPQNMVTLVGVAGVGGSTNLIPVGGSAASPYIVPTNKSFVLTDIVISPQAFPPSGYYSWYVTPSSGAFTTDIVVTSSAAEPSSFKVHLNTGMVFKSGSKIGFTLNPGSGAPVNISAFGYTD